MIRLAVKPPRILTTDQWGARPAKTRPTVTARPTGGIFHHTAGHHAEISQPQDESLEELVRYAKAIQNFHMAPKPCGNGWNDSGHNFLVGRNGWVCVGRHQSFNAILHGRMVVSAHCPSFNDWPGIEHEHLHEQTMTTVQLDASARLWAWICSRCAIRVGEYDPHRAHFPTSCPAELLDDIPEVISRAAKILNAEGRAPASRLEGLRFAARWLL
jgi:hypothetical protein